MFNASIAVLGIFIFAFSSTATTEQLIIENPSFESFSLPEGSFSNLVYNPYPSEYPLNDIHGENVCRLPAPDQPQSFSFIDITSTNLLISNSLYVLEIEKGNPEGFDYGTAIVELIAGTNILVSANNYEPPTGDIYVMTIPYVVSESHSSLGQELTVRLKNSGNGIVDYDNVILSRYTDSPKLSIHLSPSREILLISDRLVPRLRYILEGKYDLNPNSDYFFWSSQVVPQSTMTNSLGLIEHNVDTAFFTLDLNKSFYLGIKKGVSLPE